MFYEILLPDHVIRNFATIGGKKESKLDFVVK